MLAEAALARVVRVVSRASSFQVGIDNDDSVTSFLPQRFAISISKLPGAGLLARTTRPGRFQV